MFGLSFSEFVVCVVVAIVVIGPKDLPKVMRKVGMWAGKLRRMAADMRAQSGIDDVLRTEGLSESVQEIRKLARGELDNVKREVKSASLALEEARAVETSIARDREYPDGGADAYGALPDTAIVYDGSLPTSALAKDPLYRTGDENGKIPDDAPPPEAPPEAITAPALEVAPNAHDAPTVPTAPVAANGAHSGSDAKITTEVDGEPKIESAAAEKPRADPVPDTMPEAGHLEEATEAETRAVSESR